MRSWQAFAEPVSFKNSVLEELWNIPQSGILMALTASCASEMFWSSLKQ